MATPGFQIGGTLYPFVDRYRHGDPAIIRTVTGLEWKEFAALLAEASEDVTQQDPLVQTALIAVSVSRVHPNWTRDRIAQFVNSLELGSETIVGTEVDADPTDLPEPSTGPEKSPPTESNPNSTTSPTDAQPSPDESPSNPNQITSGTPGSDTTTQGSLRIA